LPWLVLYPLKLEALEVPALAAEAEAVEVALQLVALALAVELHLLAVDKVVYFNKTETLTAN
jgi:hypothetical protein